MAYKSSLHVSQLLEWADAHYERTGKWPDINSGSVQEAPHEKWMNINLCLARGLRGLPGGWSLAQLLDDFRGKRNTGNLPSLNEEQILAWADDHYQRCGAWPAFFSGSIASTKGETWSAVDMALHAGRRGLDGGSSLARLLSERRGVKKRGLRPSVERNGHSTAGTSSGVGPQGVDDPGQLASKLAELRRGRNKKRLPPFTVPQILAWADAFFSSHGAWPSGKHGLIDGTDGETWTAIDMALHRGLRGLPPGSSLARLLAEQRGVRNRAGRPALSIDQILAWADAYYQRFGVWPTGDSGTVHDTASESWKRIDGALRGGRRGLPGGSSLVRLLDEQRGTHRALNLEPLAIDQILRWADAYHERTGKWPTANMEPVDDSVNDTWNAIQCSLRSGLRGLPGRSSLAQLLAERRGVRNQAALPCLSAEQILAWADAYYARFGKWPTQKSGNIDGAPGETWNGVDCCLKSGARGLAGGSSLARLLDRCRRKLELIR